MIVIIKLTPQELVPIHQVFNCAKSLSPRLYGMLNGRTFGGASLSFLRPVRLKGPPNKKYQDSSMSTSENVNHLPQPAKTGALFNKPSTLSSATGPNGRMAMGVTHRPGVFQRYEGHRERSDEAVGWSLVPCSCPLR